MHLKLTSAKTILAWLALWSVFACRIEPKESPRNEPQVTQSVQTQTYRVVKIIDGDTFDILKDGKPQRIRIFGIDAPERGMPFYKVSKNHLSGLIANKNVSVKLIEKDRHRRLVCEVSVGKMDVAGEMVGAGLAWHFKRYSDNQRLDSLEIKARNDKLGLWQDANPVAPWDSRKIRNRKTSKPDVAPLE